jgi:hypothetical protein
MVSGGPGDHPITDLLHWNLEVYGPIPDEEFRQLAQLMSQRELDGWWSENIGWYISPETAAERIHKKLLWAQVRAEQSGWESPPNPSLKTRWP